MYAGFAKLTDDEKNALQNKRYDITPSAKLLKRSDLLKERNINISNAAYQVGMSRLSENEREQFENRVKSCMEIIKRPDECQKKETAYFGYEKLTYSEKSTMTKKLMEPLEVIKTKFDRQLLDQNHYSARLIGREINFPKAVRIVTYNYLGTIINMYADMIAL